MNKYQKLACVIARDNMKKGFYGDASFNEVRNLELASLKKWPMKKAIEYKNWSKNLFVK